jgi:anti-sigma regulatory factor (Ser/Thr protein kinase)
VTSPMWPAPTQCDVRPALPRPAPAETLTGRLAGAAELPVPPSAARWVPRPAREWARHGSLPLGALDGAVPSARLHTRHVLREWGLAALSDSAELVVSELATNGVQASRALAHTSIRLWLASDLAQVLICVWDANPQPPVPVDAAEHADHGRGLLLVEAVSAQWGWFPAEPGSPWASGPHGKVVWALIS